MSILTINIDTAGRDFLIKNNENIIIVFPQNDNDFAVSCVSFAPFGSIPNTVEFNNDWILYASSQAIAPMTVLTMGITTTATQGKVYIFDGVDFNNGSPTTSNQNYGFTYQNSHGTTNITCGLGQQIKLNSDTPQYLPLCAYMVPNYQTIYIETSSIVWIFVAKGISSNMMIPTNMLTPNTTIFSKLSTTTTTIIIGNYLEIDLKQNPAVTFNNQTHSFDLNQ